ncbi:MAG TPA: hypothetical protein VL688_01280 [Verrucomicrobiae bacterium]|nr:hypothetical protein [Verrucomicrobiae bacterium]
MNSRVADGPQTLKARAGIFAAAVFSLAAPWWAPHFQVLHNRTLFLAADSFVLLGLALLAGLAAEKFLPDACLSAAEAGISFLRRHSLAAAAAASVLVLAGLMALNRNVLHSFMNSADEHSCYFLAECFRLGKWWVKPHPLSEFFNVVHVGNRDGKWFSVYPPGWPLLLALGLQFHVQDWLNPVMSALSLPFIYFAGRKALGSGTAAAAAVLITAVCPFFLFTSAGYYSHPACLLVMAVFALAFFQWQDARSPGTRMAWACLAAAAVGYGLATRYLTMAAFSMPFLLYHYYPVLQRKRALRADDVAVALIIAAFMAVVLFQNYIVTGKITKAPNKYDKSWERLGFMSDYTPVDGLVFLLARSFYLMDWMPPLLYVLSFAALAGKREESAPQKILRFSFWYPALAYFFYFSWGGNQWGPRYWYEGFPFLMLALADGLRLWWRTGSAGLKKFLLAGLVVSVAAAGYEYAKQAAFYEAASRERKALYVKAEAELSKPSIVFIKGFLGDTLVMSEDDAVRNAPSLDARILYAHDRGADNSRLRAYYPGRECYRGTFDRAAKQARLEKI